MIRRIAAAISLTVAVVLVLVALGTFGFARIATKRADLRALETKASEIVTLIPAGVGVDDEQVTQGRELREKLAEVLQLSGVEQIVISPNGKVIGTWPGFWSPTEAELARLRDGASLSGSRHNTLWAASARVQKTKNDRESLLVVVIDTPAPAVFGPTGRWFLWSAIAASVFGAGLSLWLARRLSRPVVAAVEATNRLATGDLAARAPRGTTNDELALLADSVNSLGEQLERSKGLERQFLMSVSHDLRTPITSIRGFGEAIADGVAPDPRAAGEIIVAESDRLNRLIGDLLDLAKLDAHQFSFHVDQVLVDDAVQETARSLQLQAANETVEILVDAQSHASIAVDPQRLAQSLGNLVTNATRFARQRVLLRARSTPHAVTIEVIDDGPGIAPEDLPFIFDRLYQAQNQPNHGESGSGLGLAIVRELVTAMGGEVAVSSTQGQQSTFTISFPRSAE